MFVLRVIPTFPHGFPSNLADWRCDRIRLETGNFWEAIAQSALAPCSYPSDCGPDRPRRHENPRNHTTVR